MTTQTASNRLPGDNYVQWYVKGPKSTYAYINTIIDNDLKELANASQEEIPFRFGDYQWVKTGQIVKRYEDLTDIPQKQSSLDAPKASWQNKPWTPKPKVPAAQYEITDLRVEKLANIHIQGRQHFEAGYSPAMTERGWLQIETNDAGEKIVFFIKKKRVEYQ